MLTAVVGINWGDEGKGRMVDLLSQDYKVVSRYQGGNNAGHTVVNDRGTFILNLLPSGILREDTVNVMGPGMVIDLEHLFHETQRLRDAGIEITPAHLKISDRATVCMPYHKLMDCLEEDRLADKKFGSTRRGIAPVYADKYMKKSVRMGDLKDLAALRPHLEDIVEWKNLTVAKGYGADPISADEMMAWLEKYGLPFVDYICDTTKFLSTADDVLFEAHEGLFHLRGRRPLHLRIVRRGRQRPAGSGPRIRRGHRSSPPGGRLRRGRLPLRRDDAGRHRNRRHQAGRAVLSGGDPRVRSL